MQPPRIKRLDEKVINRIAAGEVVQRPSSALKELMENCLDAGATKVTVTLNGGGLKMMQIADNGHGIWKDDFPIVCKRFTTSKLREFNDLNTIATFGFRGEALASISHVSHLTITSKRKESAVGYKALFIDGEMQEDKPKAIACLQGTTITAENLFYNTPLRRNAMSRPSEEYTKCVRVMERYSIQFAGVQFMCRKSNSAKVDLRVELNASRLDNIRVHFGKKIAMEIVEVKNEFPSHSCKLSGVITNVNFSSKRTIFILFVNNRLVNHPLLKRAVEAIYTPLLPKHGHPWVFLDIHVPSDKIDVNVHPSKMEVQFLDEAAIIDFVSRTLTTELEKYSNSRAFYGLKIAPAEMAASEGVKQFGESNEGQYSRAPNMNLDSEAQGKKKKKKSKITSWSALEDQKRKITSLTQSASQKPVYRPHKMVRTDTSFQAGALKRFFSPSTKPFNAFKVGTGTIKCPCCPAGVDLCEKKKMLVDQATGEEALENDQKEVPKDKTKKFYGSVSRLRPISNPELDSITTLRTAVSSAADSSLRECMAKGVYVGCVDRSRFCFQYKTLLLMADFRSLSYHLFYQTVLNHFADFPRLNLKPPLLIKELVLMVINSPAFGWKPEHGEKAKLASKVVQQLTDMREMLDEYFMIKIAKDSTLCSLPNLIEGVKPALDRLPSFLLRLGSEVNWNEETSCFEGIAKELALLFKLDPKDEKEAEKLVWNIFPWFNSGRFQPPSSCTVFEIARLEQLYKVFERC